MDNNIAFELCSGDQKILLDGNQFAVVDYGGIEATDYELVTTENINGIGAKVNKRKLLPRPITIEFDYLGYDDRPAVRQKLVGFFSPLSSGILRIHYMGVTRVITYEVQKLMFSSKNVYDYISCLLELTCLDPAMLAEYSESDQMSTWIGGWKLKFTLPFHLRRRGPKQKTIINGGHLDTPVQVVFQGPAENPRIINKTTGEKIIVNQTLTEDDFLHIDTDPDHISVQIERGGTLEDAYGYIDLDTDFFMLRPGENAIEYGTDNELDPQQVVIIHRERYLGI
nr:MAG TPA: tail protein [Caudoviricetes sp.]